MPGEHNTSVRIKIRLVYVQKIEGNYSILDGLELLERSGTLLNIVA